MEVKIIASGSKANCIYVESGESGILIDAGLPKKYIENRLIDEGIIPGNIRAIFVSHDHKDHTAGLILANKYSIPVYASEGEWKGISNVNEDLRQVLCRGLDGYGCIELQGAHVYPFRVHHDAAEPLGYAVEDDVGNRCCVVFDTGRVDDEMLEMMEGNIYVIEANHEPSMVEVCNRPPGTITRILSDVGHLSNEQCAEALAKLIKGKGEKIYLTHLSRDNNTPAIAERAIKMALFEKGFVKGKHYFLEVIG